MLKPVITTFGWVPPFARGVTRDLRARWACEEEGIPYEISEIDWERSKSRDYRRSQPFGQIPTYNDGEVEIFETGAIALRIAELGNRLLPEEPAARMRAIQWVMASLNSVEPWIMRAATEQAPGQADADSAALIEQRGDGMSSMSDAAAAADLDKRLLDLDAAIGDRQWLDGDTFTVGDLMMISVLGHLRNTKALSSMPKLAAYVARGEARPAHVKAMAAQLALYEEADKRMAAAARG
jgi:glutathione S-transferase